MSFKHRDESGVIYGTLDKKWMRFISITEEFGMNKDYWPYAFGRIEVMACWEQYDIDEIRFCMPRNLYYRFFRWLVDWRQIPSCLIGGVRLLAKLSNREPRKSE